MRHTRSGGVRLALLGGILVTAFVLVGFGATAMAQEQQQEQPKTQVKEEVVVTGTLIPRPTLEAMAPVSTVEVEEVGYRGLTRLEDLLTVMPQVFAAQNSTIANGASGTATVDLRNLGAVRTLVLLDGNRLPAGDRYAISPDLNFIPAALLKRVDILTGGASATYGADAVSGVVNFIVDKEFTGTKIMLAGGGYQHSNNNDVAQAALNAKNFYVPGSSVYDGGNFEATVSLGGKFADGKGHGSAYVDYRKTSALLKKYRDYTACAFAQGGSGPICGGSGTIPNGRFLVFDTNYNQTGNYTLDEATGNTFRKRLSTDVYNYGAVNFMQRPDVRWAGGGFVNYEWNKNFEGYASVMLMDDYTDAQIAPSGNFGTTTLLNCDNPMLSPDQYQKICVNSGYGPNDMANVTIMKRNVEGGPRVDQITHTSFRLQAGLKGDLGGSWAYDVYGLHAETRVPEVYTQDLSSTRMQDALIVDGDRNDPSTWHCRSGNAGCVPWNLFKIGAVTQEQLAYIQLPLLSNTNLRTQLVSGKVTGDLFTIPSAVSAVALAVGAEYRKELMSYYPDAAYQAGDASGQGGARVPVSGDYSVQEVFVEALIPLIQGASLAKDLSLELGYRYSDYTTTGTASTWKAMGNWAPTAGFKFRAGVNRATRAPNIVELFTPQAIDLAGSRDICAGENPTYTKEQCLLTGVPLDRYGKILENPADQYNDLYGGNPNLKPEIADTQTFGIVLTPTGTTLMVALDYFDIKIADTIGTLAPDDVIQACATTGNPTLCSLIHRDRAYTLWLYPEGYTEDTNQNVGKREAEGIDANFNWSLPAGNSFFSFNLIGSYTMTSYINTGLFEYDCVGYFGDQCVGPVPEWRHLFRASWETGPIVLTLAWRYISAVKNDDLSPNAFLGDPGNVENLTINNVANFPAFNYFDLAFSWRFHPAVQFLIGVNNIMDVEPPLAAGMQDNDYGPGYYGAYDPYGRYIHAALNFNF